MAAAAATRPGVPLAAASRPGYPAVAVASIRSHLPAPWAPALTALLGLISE